MKKSSNNLTFADLASSIELKDLHQIMVDLTGIPMNLVDEEFKNIEWLSPQSDFNPICQMIRSTEEGCRKCRVTDALHSKRAARENKGMFYHCHAGLIDFVVPVTIQGKNIGIVSCGQILPSPPTEEGFQELREKLTDLSLDEQKLREAYFQSPHMQPEKLDSLLKLLSLFASYCCEVGMRLRRDQINDKYPEIAQAKDFVKDQFREQISLKTVADHVLLSEAYLSRLFHRVEGVTFSRYIQTVRIEEAKKLLARTDWSISQIVFSVGFNNASYFNEFFRKMEDCTPSQYRSREKIHANTG